MMTSFKPTESPVRSQIGQSSRQEALAMLMRVYANDIARYRRQLTRDLGCDVGLDWAAVEWLNAHCPRWTLLYWEKTVVDTTNGQFLHVADRVVCN